MASPLGESPRAKSPQSSDEDDYMKMPLADDDAPSKPETSLQRTQRLKREARERGLTKSKAQRQQEAVAAREKALATSLLDKPHAQTSKGFAMMAKMGFKGGGLGKSLDGRAAPIGLSAKADRGGVGLQGERRHDDDAPASKRARLDLDPEDYRQRIMQERLDARREAQIQAAQRLMERLDCGADSSIISRPLKSIPLVYRGLVRRARQDAIVARLPTYQAYDADDEDPCGGDPIEYLGDEVLDDEDPELEAFNALSADERLRKALEYLRLKHRYCFWCKMAYPTDDLDGCPGVTEEHHD